MTAAGAPGGNGPATGFLERVPLAAWLLVCLAGALVLAARVLLADLPFLADDYSIVAGLLEDGRLDPARLLSHFSGPRHGVFYRPVFYLSYALPYLLGGLWPLPYYVMNALLHGLASWGLLLFLLEVGAPRRWAVASMALFLVHPLHVEPISWVAGRTSLLGGLFLVLALAAFARWRRRPGPGSLSGLALAMILGLLSREDLFVLVGLVPLLDLLLPGPRAVRGWRRLAPHLLVVLLGAAYLLVRHLVGADILERWVGLAAGAQAEGQQALLASSLLRFLVPVVDGEVGGLSPPLRAVVALPSLLLLLAPLGLLARPRERRLLLSGAALLVVAMLPTAPLLAIDEQLSHGRLLYQPSLGYCILLGAGASLARPRRLARVVDLLLLLALVGGAALLVVNQGAFVRAGRMAEAFLAAVRSSGAEVLVVPMLDGPYGDRDAVDGDEAVLFAPAETLETRLPLPRWSVALLVNVPRRVHGAHVVFTGIEDALLPLFGGPGPDVLLTAVADPDAATAAEDLTFFGPLLADVPVLKWDGERLVPSALVATGTDTGNAGIEARLGAPTLGPLWPLSGTLLPAEAFDPAFSLQLPARLPSGWRYRVLAPSGPVAFPASPVVEAERLLFRPAREAAAGDALRALLAPWREEGPSRPSRESLSLVLYVEALAPHGVVGRSRPLLLRVLLPAEGARGR